YTLSRTHYNVELEHWLLRLLDIPNSDIAAILRRFEIDPGRVAAELTRVVDRLKTGNSRTPALSPAGGSPARGAPMIASLHTGAGRIRSGHLLVALLADDGLARELRESSPQLAQLSPEALRKDLAAICQDTAEQASEAPGTAAAAPGPAAGGASPALDQF